MRQAKKAFKCATPSGISGGACGTGGSSPFITCGDQITVSNIAGHACNSGAPDFDTCIYNTI